MEERSTRSSARSRSRSHRRRTTATTEIRSYKFTRRDDRSSADKLASRRKGLSKSKSRSGSSDQDDSYGHYEGRPGEMITDRYKIIKEAGVGTFGRVLEVYDKRLRISVAMKMVRNVPKYTDGAKIEAEILEKISFLKEKLAIKENSLCVRMYRSFTYRGHFCIAFEKLGSSLYEVIKKNNYKPFPFDYVKEFAQQLFQSMAFLKQIKLIHTDLKPENILLVDSSLSTVQVGIGREGYTMELPLNKGIKVIDFGGATFDEDRKSGIINTRQYRCPEVILEQVWSFPSDIWGVGCILMELYTGRLLFQTHDNYEHLALMEKILGPISTTLSLVCKSDTEAASYFDRYGLLKFHREAPATSRAHVQKQIPLKELVKEEHSLFLDLIAKCLIYNPKDRIKPEDALRHPLFTSDAIHEKSLLESHFL